MSTSGAPLDPAQHADLDPGGMLAAVEQTPSQWRFASERARAAVLPPGDPSRLRQVVVAGMGGSGIAADIAAMIASRSGVLPVIPVKGYTLPAFAGPATLVITVSHSGNTEETLACFDAAGAAGAVRYAVTSGGELATRAERDEVALVRVPAEGQPRANLPNLAVPVLVALDRLGLVGESIADQLATLPDHLDGCLASWAPRGNDAESPVVRLARSLVNVVPVFYGAPGWQSVAALRAKCQVNENAKRPAFWAALPELDHNEIVGWHASGRERRPFALVALRSEEDEDARIARRFAATADLARNHVAHVERVDVDGPSFLARFAAAVLFVDLLSVYLAFLEGIDPTPVEAIDELKARLAAE